ncbi:PA3496 family putative envelope integrity protein [Pseudomaricurvus sp.]|uniref:PA3496 family putative envelope integrity protein n=1 Tax=Pseudomaricurvus sp. TaxID=2004510 RepID=UPI003F6CDDD0
MSSEVLSTSKSSKSTAKSRRKASSQSQAETLDARRKLEERLEDMRLKKETIEFDFDFA